METRFTDGRITIRPYQFSDMDELLAASLESTHEVYPWLEWCKPSYSLQDTDAWIRFQHEAWTTRREYHFIIIDTDSRTMLGGIGLSHLHPVDRFANLGYWIRTSHTGKGVATAAVRLAAKFAFQETNLLRLEIVVNVANRASQRVAEKAGAHKEGVLRSRIFMHGKSHDAVMFSLIPADMTHRSNKSTQRSS